MKSEDTEAGVKGVKQVLETEQFTKEKVKE